jgi:hypothetical protein
MAPPGIRNEEIPAMPAFYRAHIFPKRGPFRRIFVVGGDTAGHTLDRAMGKNYQSLPRR